MFERDKLKVCLLLTIITGISGLSLSHAGEIKQYRPPHSEICFEVGKYKIECGNFQLSSTLLSKKYRAVSTGTDVMSSFSAKTHPGDHPFLKRLANRLDYVDEDPNSITNAPYNDWEHLNPKTQNDLIDRYSSIATTEEAKKKLANYLGLCINYWVNPNATYDKRLQAPTLAEVSALCVADSGILGKPAP